MSPTKRRKPPERRGQTAKAPTHADLTGVVRETARLWRKHHLGYDQTRYVVEQVRRRLGPTPPASRPRTVERLDRAEVERLVAAAYRDGSRRGPMVKTLFLTGARVSELVHTRVEDLHPDDDPPRIHLAHAEGHASRSVPILPTLAQELRTHLQGRTQGYLFESNRRTRYAVRTVQTMVRRCARVAGITRQVHPHLLRHSIATILLDSGQVPIDQVRKFLGHLHLSTT
jgi:integrase/recombinase XerD